MTRAARRSLARLAVANTTPADAWRAWMHLGEAATSTWLAAAQVVSLRMPLLAAAMISPEGHRDPEVRRMFSEKPLAFARSWQILAWQLAASPMQAHAAALAPLRRAAKANARRLLR
ncbi:MAG: hypothetical protein RIB84_15065 [Sneathiellaceae bacterium]